MWESGAFSIFGIYGVGALVRAAPEAHIDMRIIDVNFTSVFHIWLVDMPFALYALRGQRSGG